MLWFGWTEVLLRLPRAGFIRSALFLRQSLPLIEISLKCWNFDRDTHISSEDLTYDEGFGSFSRICFEKKVLSATG